MCNSPYPGPLPGGSGASMSVQFYKLAVVIVHACELMMVDTEKYVEIQSLNGSAQNISTNALLGYWREGKFIVFGF